MANIRSQYSKTHKTEKKRTFSDFFTKIRNSKTLKFFIIGVFVFFLLGNALCTLMFGGSIGSSEQMTFFYHNCVGGVSFGDVKLNAAGLMAINEQLNLGLTMDELYRKSAEKTLGLNHFENIVYSATGINLIEFRSLFPIKSCTVVEFVDPVFSNYKHFVHFNCYGHGPEGIELLDQKTGDGFSIKPFSESDINNAILGGLAAITVGAVLYGCILAYIEHIPFEEAIKIIPETIATAENPEVVAGSSGYGSSGVDSTDSTGGTGANGGGGSSTDVGVNSASSTINKKREDTGVGAGGINNNNNSSVVDNDGTAAGKFMESLKKNPLMSDEELRKFAGDDYADYTDEDFDEYYNRNIRSGIEDLDLINEAEYEDDDDWDGS